MVRRLRVQILEVLKTCADNSIPRTIGWAFVFGNMIITLSVNFGTALFFIGCVNIFRDADGNGIWEVETYHTYLVFLAITLTTNSISALLNKWLPKLDVRSPLLNTISAVPSQPKADEMINTDSSNLLDFWWSYCDSVLYNSNCEPWKKLWHIRIYAVQPDLRVDSRMGFLRRSTARSLRYIGFGNDSLVSGYGYA